MKHKSKKRTRKYIKKLRNSKKRTRKYNKSNKIKYKKRINYKSTKKRFRTRLYKRNARKSYKKGGAPTLDADALDELIRNIKMNTSLLSELTEPKGLLAQILIIQGLMIKLEESLTIGENPRDTLIHKVNEKLSRKILDLNFFIDDGQSIDKLIEQIQGLIRQIVGEGISEEAPEPREPQPGEESGRQEPPEVLEPLLEEALGRQEPQEPRRVELASTTYEEATAAVMDTTKASLVYTNVNTGANLYLGGLIPGTSREYLKSINCKFVISIIHDLHSKLDPVEKQCEVLHMETTTLLPTAQVWDIGTKIPHNAIISPDPRVPPHGFMVRWNIPINDKDDISLIPYFEMTSGLIDIILSDRGQNVLVHCSTGASRSSTIVIAYSMIKLGRTLKQAYGEVYSKRPIIRPGKDFFSELMYLDSVLYFERNMCGIPEEYKMTWYDYFAYMVQMNIKASIESAVNRAIQRGVPWLVAALDEAAGKANLVLCLEGIREKGCSTDPELYNAVEYVSEKIGLRNILDIIPE